MAVAADLSATGNPMVLSYAHPGAPLPARPLPITADARVQDSVACPVAPLPAVAAAPLPANLPLDDLIRELVRGLGDGPRPLPAARQALAVAHTLRGLIEPQLLREQAVALEAALAWAQLAGTAVHSPLALATAQARLLNDEALLPTPLRDATSAMCAGLRQAEHVLAQLQRLTGLREKDWGPGVEPTLELAQTPAADLLAA